MVPGIDGNVETTQASPLSLIENCGLGWFGSKKKPEPCVYESSSYPFGIKAFLLHF